MGIPNSCLACSNSWCWALSVSDYRMAFLRLALSWVRYGRLRSDFLFFSSWSCKNYCRNTFLLLLFSKLFGIELGSWMRLSPRSVPLLDYPFLSTFLRLLNIGRMV